jgi:hypothetical protein
LDQGIDYQALTITQGEEVTKEIIPEFTMPAVSAAGPLHFYAAMFQHGYLDLDHLVSNGAVWEFSLE